MNSENNSIPQKVITESRLSSTKKLEKIAFPSFVVGLFASILAAFAFISLLVGSNSASRGVGFFLLFFLDSPLLIISNILSFVVFYRLCVCHKINQHFKINRIAFLAILLSNAPFFAFIIPFIKTIPLFILPLGIIIAIYLAIALAVFTSK